MDKPLYVIEPFKQGMDNWLIFSIAVAILSAIGYYYFKQNKTLDYNRRNIITLLFSFFAVIALGVVGLKLYSKWRIQPVEIYNNRIKTPYGEAPLSNIIDFYIKMERKEKPMQVNMVQDSAHYFFIIERNNKTHVLSEGDYPIKEVMDKLNDVMGY